MKGITVTFAQMLRELREAAGVSQVGLANAVDMHPSHLNRVEAGTRNPPRQENVLAIAEVLGLTREDTDRLLLAAGYAPQNQSLNAVGPSETSELKTHRKAGLEKASHSLAQEIGKEIDTLLTAVDNGSMPDAEARRVESGLAFFLDFLRHLHVSYQGQVSATASAWSESHSQSGTRRDEDDNASGASEPLAALNRRDNALKKEVEERIVNLSAYRQASARAECSRRLDEYSNPRNLAA